jgi:Ca2+-binding RTX toxin-like protein
MSRSRSPRRSRRSFVRPAVAGGAALALLTTLGTTDVLASVIVGTPGNDVTFGQDRDNAGNPLIQPPGVTVPQHLSNTDVAFGRLGDDLVTGGPAGRDVLIGGEGNDVLIGESGSDVLLGDEGNDVSVWSTGDGSETFVGDEGNDTLIVGALDRVGQRPRLVSYQGRQVPQARLLSTEQSCALTPVPAGEDVGEQYLVRVLVGGRLQATIRARDVEQVVCSSPVAGRARVADLRAPGATFETVRISALPGVPGAIVR